MSDHPPSGTAEERALPALVPARMLNEFAYCPRLAYLEWVQGEFADSADTIEGRFHHRNVDSETGALPDAPDLAEHRFHARSLLLSAPSAGLIARIDLVEADGRLVTPVDYKRGRAPDIPERAWEPERVQLCAQALILEENGYQVDRGILYFVASRQRVEIQLDEALRTRTRALLAELRARAAGTSPPPPLVDSPKCPRCSLVGICLPDEVNLLHEEGRTTPVRRLTPARDDALPLYVHSAGARIGRRGEELQVETRDGERLTARIADTSQVVVFGAVQVSTQALQALCDRGITTTYLSSGGWLYGHTRSMDHKHVELRRRQFATAADDGASLRLARRMVSVKIQNCRTLVRRNGEPAARATLSFLRDHVDKADAAGSLESLLGVEGSAARAYFEAFASLLRPPASQSDGDTDDLRFDFEGRNRRPPRDPVNAMLSFGYALLTKDLVITLAGVGFDPYMGFYHQPRYGRPALALDVMEEFRPLIVDSLVLTTVNTGTVQRGDFLRRGGAVTMTPAGRTKMLRAYERRMDEEITHPVFGYRISYRRVLEVQARLLARYLAGEIDEYPPFTTR